MFDVNAQQCGTESPQNYQTYENNPNSIPTTVGSNYCVNVAFRIVRNNDGSNGYDPANIPAILNNLNQVFNPHGITIVQLGTFDYLNNSALNNATAPSNIVAIPNAINIYLVTNLLWAGITNTSPEVRIRIKKSAIFSIDNALAHELGHCFNLLHTFECSNPYYPSCADNPLNTVNCLTKGDFICDTPPDYNPLKAISTQDYPSPYTISNYNPDFSNIMSYHLNLKDHFTLGQGLRMRNSILNLPYLQNVRSNKCTKIEGSNYICGSGNYNFSTIGYGSPINYSWSVSNNLLIVGSSTTANVVITSSNPNNVGTATIYVTINGTTISKIISIGAPIINSSTQLIGVYDWVSVGYGNMGIVAPTNSSIESFKWIIEEDSDFTNNCTQSSKPRFIGSNPSTPYLFISTTNQAVVNWGTCSNSYLISCYAYNSCGENIYQQRYVDVGLPKNNPCFTNGVFTIIAPNPIQNKEINIIVNKTPQQSPCNWKTNYIFQDFNNRLDLTRNEVSIYDFNGNFIHSEIFETDEFTVKDLNLIEGNNYIVNLTTNEGVFSQQIIIVE